MERLEVSETAEQARTAPRPRRQRFRRLRRLPLVSPRLWLRRMVFWLGAVLVGLVAIAFAALADRARQGAGVGALRGRDGVREQKERGGGPGCAWHGDSLCETTTRSGGAGW